jgi:acetyltransferase-like isoleucine patch superfamily enzyme
MATLIGAGSHATDIAHTYWFDRHYPHHNQYEPDGQLVVIGINNPQTRSDIASQIGRDDAAWIHPDAYLGPETTYGSGTHINYNATMTRTRIGRHCTISPGVTICGDVIIGDRVLIGAGATICDRVTIHNDVTIGAGCVILPETTLISNSTWVGVPGKQIR